MKKSHHSVALCIICTLLYMVGFAQSGMWTWMKGDSGLYNQANYNYGIMGVPNSVNEPPGRYDAAFWTDTAGRFWIYGGVNPYGTLFDDLWMFDPNTLMWTWKNSRSTSDTFSVIAAVKGVYSAQNKPRSLGYSPNTWVTSDNHLWLFGGQYPAPDNDFNREMWQYDPAIDQWAWMGTFDYTRHGIKGSGTSNTSPGGRIHANVSWTDSTGNLWIYGGLYFDPNIWYWKQMGDIWKYDITSGIWNWMSGDSTANPQGVYGPVGVPSTNNSPLARNTQFYWKDDSYNLWLAGGENYISSQFYNDVWKFNSKTLEWTLIQGTATPDTTNITTGDCIHDINNRQGGRYQNRATWNICNNVILNYGGFKTLDGFTNINDLWGFLPTQNVWVRINHHASTGAYGIKGIASPSNYPRVRSGSAGFTDKHGNAWLFSGNGNFSNDLWKFTLDTACIGNVFCNSSCTLAPVTLTADSLTICANDSTPVCAPVGYQSYIWNNGESSRCIYAKNAGNYYVTVTDNNSCSVQSNHISVNVYPLSSVSVSVNGDTLSAYNAAAYQWFLNNNPVNGATSPVFVISQPGSYTVAVTDSNGCSAFSNAINITVVPETVACNFFILPNPANKTVTINVDESMVGNTIMITDVTGRKILAVELTTRKSAFSTSNFTAGIYLVTLENKTGRSARKLIIQK